MYRRLFTVISRILNVAAESLNEDSTQDTVGDWDSLKHMNLIMALEEEYNIVFSDEEIAKIRSVNNIIELLRKKGIANDNL